MQLTKYGVTGAGTDNERVTLRLVFSTDTDIRAIDLTDRALEFKATFELEHGDGTVRDWEPSDVNTGYSVAAEHADTFLTEFNEAFN